MLENLTKPVTPTGKRSCLSANCVPTARRILMTAIEIASAKDEDGHPMVPEVYIFFNGKLIRGNRAIKINAEGFMPSNRSNHPHLCDVGINFQYHRHHILTPDYDKPMVPI